MYDILWKIHSIRIWESWWWRWAKIFKKNSQSFNWQKDTTIYFVMYLPAKTFSTALFSLGCSHKSYGYKEMRCSDFKAAPLKEYFCEPRTSLRAIQCRSENTTSQNSALHEHRKCITWRHCYGVLYSSGTQPLYNPTVMCYAQHRHVAGEY